MVKIVGLIKTLGLKHFLWKSYLYYKKKLAIEKLTTNFYPYNNRLINKIDCYNLFVQGFSNNTYFNDKNKQAITSGLRLLDNKEYILKQSENIIEHNKITLFSNIEIVVNQIDYNFDYINKIFWRPGMLSSQYFQFDEKFGDIKRVWELNRFQFMNPIVPSFLINENEDEKIKCKEYISYQLNSWMNQCPYMKSVAWACSQEVSIRLFNIIFYYWLCDLEQSSLNKKNFFNLIILSADKIYKDIDYARAQRNNHSITEAMALILVSIFFYNHPNSRKYYLKGVKVLLESINDQFFSDGSYIQNSHTYHRFALQSIVVVYEIISDIDLKNKLYPIILKSFNFLVAHIVNNKGEFPNYGPNDGALLYNYGSADYRSMFPLLYQLANILNIKYEVPSNVFKVDDVIFLNKKKPICSDKKKLKISNSFPASGYYRLTNKNFTLFFRCGTYSKRLPSQADMLHVDLWFKGKNILVDSGTYEYFGNSKTERFKYFLSSSAHNTIVIDNYDQIVKGPRFTWLSSLSASLIENNNNYLSGEHYGYKKRVEKETIHRRNIELLENKVVITDILYDVLDHNITLYWHLGDFTIIEDENNKFGIKELDLKLTFDPDSKIKIEDKPKSLYYSNFKTSPSFVIKKIAKNKMVELLTTIEI